MRFTPGARTNWYSHTHGQTVHCTDGIGLVVSRDGTTIRMHPGDTVRTPPGEEHWHSGTADGDGDGTTWLEPVTDEHYHAAHS